MSTIQIETPQNVRIEYEYASLGLRIAGWFIDAGFIAVYILAVFYLIGIFAMGDLAYTAGLLLYIPLFFYDLIFEYYFKGQSPAKMILKLRVIRLDGSAPSFVSYFIRWMTRFIDISFSFGGLAIMTYFFSGRGQRLGDIAAGTSVVKISGRNIRNGIRLINFPVGYRVTYPEVRLLNDEEIRLINEVINRVTTGVHRAEDSGMLERTAELISRRLGISLSPDAGSLQILVRDYYFLAIQED